MKEESINKGASENEKNNKKEVNLIEELAPYVCFALYILYSFIHFHDGDDTQLTEKDIK